LQLLRSGWTGLKPAAKLKCGVCRYRQHGGRLSDAAEGLGRRKAKSATDKLIHLLGDNNMVVRAYAAEALGNIGEEKAAGPLIKLLGDTMAKKPKGPIITEEWGEDADTAVAALIKITCTNFAYDAVMWNTWEAEKKSDHNAHR
jgi:hypothetical protein